MQLTDKEIFLYPVGPHGWIGAMQFIVDNSTHKEGLKVLAGLELAQATSFAAAAALL